MAGLVVHVLLCAVVSACALVAYHVLVMQKSLVVRTARAVTRTGHGSETAELLHARLTREYEASVAEGKTPEEEVEGHSAQCSDKPALHRALVLQRAAQPRVQVCETGFNLGHSAVTWLSAAPNVHLLSFDLGDHEYARFGASFVARVFGADRFQIVFGDSLKTVPEHFAAHPELRCDIFMVDGGHAHDVAVGDLANGVGSVVPHGLLLIDDTNCQAEFCVDAPWRDFVAKNQHRLVPGACIEYQGPDTCHAGSGLSGAFVTG